MPWMRRVVRLVPVLGMVSLWLPSARADLIPDPTDPPEAQPEPSPEAETGCGRARDAPSVSRFAPFVLAAAALMLARRRRRLVCRVALPLTLGACSPAHEADTPPRGSGDPSPHASTGVTSSPTTSQPMTTPIEPTTPSPARAPREWNIERGALRMHIVDRPGHLVDGNAPPPPPGQPLAPHPFLSGSCSADPLGCSEAGNLLRASTSTDDFIARLTKAGFTVKPRVP